MSETNQNNQNLNDDNQQHDENKVFSEEYVKALRGESKQYRLKAKDYETKLRQILNLGDDADLANIDSVITSYQENLTKTQNEKVAKAKEILFQAELKKYEGTYNMKLVSKLLDTTKVQVDDDGKVAGLQEAIKELEKEYPEIIKNTSSGGANPVLNDKKTDKQENLFKKALGLF